MLSAAGEEGLASRPSLQAGSSSCDRSHTEELGVAEEQRSALLYNGKQTEGGVCQDALQRGGAKGKGWPRRRTGPGPQPDLGRWNRGCPVFLQHIGRRVHLRGPRTATKP